MKHAIFAALALCTMTSVAHAEGPAFVRGQFAAGVERGQPSGDAAAIAAAPRLIYWVELRNDGPSTPVTLVWRVNGHVVTRQSLDVGRSPHWRTWGFIPRRAVGSNVEVTVLDASGATLHADRLAAQ